VLGELCCLEPLVIADGWLWCLGSDRVEGELVTARGVCHELARLGPVDMVEEHLRVRMLAQLQHEEQELFETEPLAYFLYHLVPLSRGGEGECRAQLHELPRDSAGTLPAPDLPSPSLWVLGRCWLLEEGDPKPGGLRIFLGGRCLRPCGEFFPTVELEARWRRQVEEHLPRSWALAAIEAELAEQRAQLEEEGALIMGDLVLISNEHGLFLGHIVPPHENRQLGGWRERDLAVVTPLRLPLPASPERLEVFARVRGRWQAIEVFLCPGQAPAAAPDMDPGTRLILQLRWVALQIAAHGRFSELG
jgi:hypothetical protein